VLTDNVRAAAFRRLLRTNTPVAVDELTSGLHEPPDRVHAAVDALAEQGRIRCDADGRIVGAAGLSVWPDRHQIDLNPKRYWTWCAYDFLGIFAALGATGQASSPIPDTDEVAVVEFLDGAPHGDFVLLLPSDDVECCGNVYEQWCPNSNLFRTAADAAVWAAQHGLTGSALALTDAAEHGGARWRPHVQARAHESHRDDEAVMTRAMPS
jgi:hypothetical protein